ncbi:hypothetical protein GPX89_08305 [Nocardia sp. ET3-3]|uniref:Alpha-L-arabinofuranosidase n=1 Tax=Nocardia terrae TaxID=2675851 RepID=A0A7K1USB7_9NOCA|nr:hypothetical protein [Nocardia terrae]MVU77246.1 hypothetical protein [Nocardia terrae]
MEGRNGTHLTRRGFARGVAGAAAMAALATTLNRPGTAAAEPSGLPLLPGPTHPLEPEFFGLNGARIVSPQNAAQWVDARYLDALAEARPGFIRVFGGTTAEWLDWRTGEFIQEPDGLFAGNNEGRRPLRLEDWAEIVTHVGAQPVFDLNVLTSTLDEQVAMLHAAQGLGMRVRHIELGNELWDTHAYYRRVYPTGADYAHAMNDWIPVLRKEFPDARIAVCGADETAMLTTDKRFATWNRGLYDTIRDADAVVFHVYWQPDPVAADIDSTAGAGSATWERFSRGVLDAVPSGLRVWLTEYNRTNYLSKLPGGDSLSTPKQTWAHGLSVASFTLRALADPRVDMAILHSGLNGATVADQPASKPNVVIHAFLADGTDGSELFGRTALYHALTPISRALRRSDTVAELALQDPPRIPTVLVSPPTATAAAAVTAVELRDADRWSAILINNGSTAVTVNLPRDVPDHLHTITFQAGGAATPAFDPADRVTTTEADADTTITLPPYSETVVTQR